MNCSRRLTLIQTGKIQPFPVVLIGTDYWKGLFDWLRDRVLAASNIEDKDLRLVQITDSPEEAVRWLVTCYEGQCWVK